MKPALSVECPYCGVPAGAKCRRIGPLNDYGAVAFRPHASRSRRAKGGGRA